jgi:N-acetyldiaminopimelate deacetylase
MEKKIADVLTAQALREEIHRHPELSFAETETTKLLAHNLQNFLKLHPELTAKSKLHFPQKTGLVLDYQGAAAATEAYCLVRADIDALPLTEETRCSFASQKNQVMHACGHDIHTAIVYGLICEVLPLLPQQNLLFLFQPAEESALGAKDLLDSQFLKNYKIRAAYALHVDDAFPLGSVATNPTTLFGAGSEIDVHFHGVSSHIAFPHLGKNPIKAARSFLDLVEKIPADPFLPQLCGFGLIQAGTIRNILPQKALLQGSLRTVGVKQMLELKAAVESIARGLSSASGVEVEIRYGSSYPSVANHPTLYAPSVACLKGALNFIECAPRLAGEDFSFLSQAYPSFMFWLGTRDENMPIKGLHHPQFLPGHTAILHGIKAFRALLSLSIT